jgi:hypothetical protein
MRLRRRPRLALHDASGPLPFALSADDPRLAELRAAYAEVALPASRWHEDARRDFLDLRFFRGETLITWHRREEDPLATRLKFYVLLRAVAERDDLGLLGRLAEDGAFGCWTFDFDGWGRVSRDLLESAGELNALARLAGLGAGTTVLDVGAGYGRLAHRATEAGLGRWTCTDAIPESTFVCEAYLRHRGVAPPVEVVPLHEHGRLGRFDLAVNVHSFSEVPLEAARWWIERVDAGAWFVVPNETDGLTSQEADGARRDLLPVFAAAGYRLAAREPLVADPAARDLLGVQDHHLVLVRG